MDFLEYQRGARSTAIYRNQEEAIFCTLMGLNGEAGEVAEKFKKLVRDGKNGLADLAQIPPETKVEIVKELGDVLWYVSVLADYLGISMEDVAQRNLSKLKSRFDRGQIQGSGDNR